MLVNIYIKEGLFSVNFKLHFPQRDSTQIPLFQIPGFTLSLQKWDSSQPRVRKPYHNHQLPSCVTQSYLCSPIGNIHMEELC